MTAGLCLPPGIYNRALAATYFLIIPHPGFRVDRLAYRPENTQCIQLIFCRPPLSQPHQGANGSRSGINNCNSKLVANLPEPPGIRVGGNPFKHKRSSTVGKRAVNNIAMSRHPADIGGAPEDIVVMDIENNLMGKRNLQQVATCGMKNALGLTGRTRGVKHK